jgi:hypothetical protein
MTLAVMGYHLQVITDRLGSAVKTQVVAGVVETASSE